MAVTAYIIMGISKFIGIVVLMAVNAAEGLEIALGSMAFRTIIPGSLVFSAEDGEIQGIVLGKITGIPAGLGGMACLAICWEITGFMIRTCSSPEIGFVTGETIRRGVGKIPTYMTAIAIIDQMPPCQRKKQVIGCPRHPLPIRQG